MKTPGTSKSSEFYSQMQELYGKIKPSYKIDFALNTQVNCNPDMHEFSPDFIMKQQMPWQIAEEERIIHRQYNKNSNFTNFQSELRTIQYMEETEQYVKRRIRQIQREKGINTGSPLSDDHISPKKGRRGASPSPKKQSNKNDCLQINLFDANENLDKFEYKSPIKKPK